MNDDGVIVYLKERAKEKELFLLRERIVFLETKIQQAHTELMELYDDPGPGYPGPLKPEHRDWWRPRYERALVIFSEMGYFDPGTPGEK